MQSPPKYKPLPTDGKAAFFVDVGNRCWAPFKRCLAVIRMVGKYEPFI